MKNTVLSIACIAILLTATVWVSAQQAQSFEFTDNGTIDLQKGPLQRNRRMGSRENSRHKGLAFKTEASYDVFQCHPKLPVVQVAQGSSSSL